MKQHKFGHVSTSLNWIKNWFPTIERSCKSRTPCCQRSKWFRQICWQAICHFLGVMNMVRATHTKYNCTKHIHTNKCTAVSLMLQDMALRACCAAQIHAIPRDDLWIQESTGARNNVRRTWNHTLASQMPQLLQFRYVEMPEQNGSKSTTFSKPA